MGTGTPRSTLPASHVPGRCPAVITGGEQRGPVSSCGGGRGGRGPLAQCAAAVRRGGGSSRPQAGGSRLPAGGPAPADRRLPGEDGRRIDPDVRGVPRPAQPRAGAGQGRDPVPPGGDPERGQGAGHVDDLEVRRGGHPLRRGQGRRGRRSQEAEHGRAGAAHPPLRRRDLRAHRAGPRHPRPRRQHHPPGDGLDHGHDVDERRALHPGGRDRQADRRRGQPGAQRGHRARGGSGRPARVCPPRTGPPPVDGGGPGLRQRREHRGPADGGRRLQDPRRLRHRGRHLE